MSSIIRMRNGVIGGLLRKLPAGTAPALGSYPQQSCPTMSRLYGEAVPSNGSLRIDLVGTANPGAFSFNILLQNCTERQAVYERAFPVNRSPTCPLAPCYLRNN